MSAKKAKNTKPEEDKKVFDVSKPDQSESALKPAIVSRKRVEKDPMITGQDEKAEEDKPIKTKPSELKIEPTNKEGAGEQLPEDAPEDSMSDDSRQPEQTQGDQSEDSSPDAPADTTAQASTSAKLSGESSEEQEAPPDKDDSGNNEPKTGAVETHAEEAGVNKKSKKEAEQASRQAQALQQLVDSKKYHLNIDEIKRRRTTMRFLIVLIAIIVLAAAAYNFALDAEMIDSSIQPLTDIL